MENKEYIQEVELESYDGYKKYFQLKNRTIKANMKMIGDIEKLREMSKNPLLTDKGKANTIKKTVELEVKLKQKNGKALQIDESTLNVLNNISKKADGGIFSGGKWRSIKRIRKSASDPDRGTGKRNL